MLWFGKVASFEFVIGLLSKKSNQFEIIIFGVGHHTSHKLAISLNAFFFFIFFIFYAYHQSIFMQKKPMLIWFEYNTEKVVHVKEIFGKENKNTHIDFWWWILIFLYKYWAHRRLKIRINSLSVQTHWLKNKTQNEQNRE